MRSLFPFLISLLCLSTSILRGQATAEEPTAKKPNILLIYTDDQSYRTVSCYPEAYGWAHTPNIDRLAERGVRFTHAYIGTWCMPSRATMLTGLLQHGVESMRMEGEYPGSEYDPEQCKFWPSDFRKQGYTTAHIGKWHTGTDTGFGRDWDYQIVWNRPRHPDNAGAYYYDQLLETNGGEAKMTPGYTTDNYAAWGDEFIRGKHRSAEKPWYLWLCFGAVHGPFTPAERHLDSYPLALAPTPGDIFPPRPGKPDYMQTIEEWIPGSNGKPFMKGKGFNARTVDTKGLHGNSLSDWVRQYHQGVLAIDEAVGKLMHTLEETGQLDNTLVIFTSDQGFAWGQHGFRMKLAPYDATIRSPLIVSFPDRVEQGKVCEHPVTGPDVIPTIYSFAGLDLPWKMHGRDLTPLLKNPESTWPHPALMTFTADQYGSNTKDPATSSRFVDKVPWWVSLSEGHFKYIRTLEADEIEELYDLRSDPAELHNLALDPNHADQLKSFRNKTIAELHRTEAPFVGNLPPVKTEFE